VVQEMIGEAEMIAAERELTGDLIEMIRRETIGAAKSLAVVSREAVDARRRTSRQLRPLVMAGVMLTVMAGKGSGTKKDHCGGILWWNITRHNITEHRGEILQDYSPFCFRYIYGCCLVQLFIGLVLSVEIQ